MYNNNENNYGYASAEIPVQYGNTSSGYYSYDNPTPSYQSGYNQLMCSGSAAPAARYENTDAREIVNGIAKRSAVITEKTKELAGRFNEIQARVNSGQEWLDNQNGIQRFVHGISGKTKRVEREVNRCTRESVGVLAETVNVLYNHNNVLMDTIVLLGKRIEMQEAENNRQNQIFMDILRGLDMK